MSGRPRCPICGTPVNTPGWTRCWRHRRKAATSKRRVHRDPVTPDVAALVLARDAGCVGPRLGFPGPCRGRRTLDHVDNAGHGKRGPSTPDNLVTLCEAHHDHKTTHARAARYAIRLYLPRRPAGAMVAPPESAS